MKIYKQEILDGISEQVKSQASIKSFVLVKNSNFTKADRTIVTPDNREPHSEEIEEPSELDPDLYPLKTVLVSSGWNKNDDVFSKEELYKSKDTPVNKKIDFQHDELIIIGHINNSYICDKSGIELNCSMEELPEECDIITEGFLYTLWQDQERQHLINSIIEGIPQDKWFVSMECYFEEFDYAIKKDEKTWVLQRNEETAFLTKHMRSYGGSGEYNGYKVGRLIKNLVFSGKGIVENPANPDSVFLEVESFSTKNEISNFNFDESSVYIHKEESDMDLEKELAKTQKELAEATQVIADLQVKLTAKASAEADAEKKTLEIKLETAKADVESYKSKSSIAEQAIENLKAELEAAKNQAEALQKEKEEMAKKAKSATRATKLVEAGLTEAEANERAEKWIDVSDDIFDDFVVAMKSKKATTEPAKAEETTVIEDTVAETEVETESIVAEEVSPDAELMTSVANFFENSLKFNHKKNTKGEK